MAHVVTEARAQVRAALETALPSLTWVRDHWRSVGRGQLPRATVYTPRVGVSRFDAVDVARDTEFRVLVKIEGDDDLDDDLDALSAVIEATVLTVLAGLSHDYDLTEVATRADGTADAPVGELMLKFRAVLVTPEGDPSA